LYRGLVTSETHQSSPSTTRYGSAVPGFAARPKARVRPNVPAGVFVEVSLAVPTPAAPTLAGTGPSTAVQPEGSSSQAVNVALLDDEEAATTVTTCDPGGSAPSGRTDRGSAATVVARAVDGAAGAVPTPAEPAAEEPAGAELVGTGPVGAAAVTAAVLRGARPAAGNRPTGSPAASARPSPPRSVSGTAPGSAALTEAARNAEPGGPPRESPSSPSRKAATGTPGTGVLAGTAARTAAAPQASMLSMTASETS